MKTYVVFRDSIFREKCIVRAENADQAVEKAANGEEQDVADIDYIEMCDNANEWKVVEA